MAAVPQAQRLVCEQLAAKYASFAALTNVHPSHYLDALDRRKPSLEELQNGASQGPPGEVVARPQSANSNMAPTASVPSCDGWPSLVCLDARPSLAEIRKYYDAVKEIDRLANDQEFFGLFRVDTRSLKDAMIAKASGD